MRNRKNTGFTLVELLVVMSILGVLMALLVTNFQRIRVRGRDQSRKADLLEVKKALQLYYSDYQSFPDSNNDGDILGCGTNGTTACTWGGAFSAGGKTYMSALPIDPVNTNPYWYEYEQISADSYVLTVTLENASDQDAAKSQTRCGTGSGRMYVVCQD